MLRRSLGVGDGSIGGCENGTIGKERIKKIIKVKKKKIWWDRR